MQKQSLTENRNLHWLTALLAAVCAVLTVGFIVYRNGGIFTYYGDYNCQQIDFYMHAHEMVRNGQFGWDWNTDLGVNFIGSYSFYLLFSPFFWLTLPFDTAMVPYLMAPLFVLKFAVSAFTSYFFFTRFVNDKRFAVIGGLLYAFSGYCIYNLFFNHFLDVVAFFPLLLIGLEELLTENRKGVFAAAVFLNAVVNYWFFIGEVVFTVIYFFARISDKKFRGRWNAFLKVLIESVIGLGLAMAVVLPSVMAIWDNPRTGSDNFINGWYMWLYYSEQRVPAILASFFFPPDLPSKQNMFPSQGAQWASMAGWIPLYGMTGALAWMFNKKKNWIARLLYTLFVFALVPVLNSLFILLNNSYYARWFYMFDLILVLATVMALERMTDPEKDYFDFKRGLIPAAAVTGITGLILFLTPVRNDGEWSVGLTYDSSWFVMTFIFAAVSLGFVFLLYKFRMSKGIKTVAVILTAVMCASYGATYVNWGYTFAGDHQEIINDAVGLSGKMSLPEDDSDSGFVRADFYDCFENMGLYWEIPSIRCFHSIVPASVMEFYPEVGVTRDVSSKPDYDLYALRSLLSVRYLYADDDETTEDMTLVQGFSFLENDSGYNVYENDNFIPMGFSYKYYITEDDYSQISEEERGKVLVKALVLSNSQILRYSHCLTHLPDPVKYIDYDSFCTECRRRSNSSCYFFKCSDKGFTARINLDDENLVFFSVPYEKGWKAYVNGVETAIENIDHGFMAVFCRGGSNLIEFRYETPGLKAGIAISAVSAVILACYLLYFRRREKLRQEGLMMEQYYKERNENGDIIDEDDLTLEEDLSIIRSPEETPEYHEYMGPEEKIYPDL